MAVLLFYTWAARLASKFVSVYVRSSVSYVIRKLWWSKQAYGKYKVRRVDVFRTNVLSGTSSAMTYSLYSKLQIILANLDTSFLLHIQTCRVSLSQDWSLSSRTISQLENLFFFSSNTLQTYSPMVTEGPFWIIPTLLVEYYTDLYSHQIQPSGAGV